MCLIKKQYSLQGGNKHIEKSCDGVFLIIKTVVFMSGISICIVNTY